MVRPVVGVVEAVGAPSTAAVAKALRILASGDRRPRCEACGKVYRGGRICPSCVRKVEEGLNAATRS